MFQISRCEIPTTVFCVNCFQNSGTVENHHLNVRCKFCVQHDNTIFKFWTSKAVYNKACKKYAILHVKVTSKQRVIISIMTGNIMYSGRISRYVLLSYWTLLRIVQNSNKTKTLLVQIQKNSKVSSEVRLVV